MSILKRDVFFDNTGGIVRFWDFAIVTTTLGTMAEPFSPNVRHSPGNDLEDFDPADEIARIDSIRAFDRNKSLLALSGGDRALNGGDLQPRTGP